MFEIIEGFTFAGKSTMEQGFRLVGRDAPTPSEKEIVESVPFAQGVYDFSAIMGDRVYENRTITYQFLLLQSDYPHRKIAEIQMKNWLMTPAILPLYDTHDYGYHWLGKFTSVSVDDSHHDGTLVVSAEFSAYPFMIADLPEGNDVWDTFNFELDVAQTVDYTVIGSETITLYNLGGRSIAPKITASSKMSIIMGGTTYSVPAGESKSETFRLAVGVNTLTINGTGTIKFEFYKELMA